MKKTVLLVTILICLAALTACGGNKTTPGSTPVTGTPGEAVTPVEVTSPTPTITEAPEPIATPEPTATPGPTPVPTGAPIPAGYSDGELMKRAIEEAKEAVYAYRSENVLTGGLGYYDGFDYDIEADKAVTYYDADGNERLVRYYLKDKLVWTRSRGCFGTLDTEGGDDSEPEWSAGFLDYSETDDQGRKTVAFLEGVKCFYTYDQDGRLLSERNYYGDLLSKECLYDYDADGTLHSEVTNFYWEGDNTLSLSEKMTYENGRIVLKEVTDRNSNAWELRGDTVSSLDDEYRVNATELAWDESVHNYQVSYEYDESGALVSETHTSDTGKKLAKVTYAYSKDEKGRIAGVGVSYNLPENETDNKLFYAIKYYDNGPVMLVPRVSDGDKYMLAASAKVFLPNAEIKEMLETGNGFSMESLQLLLSSKEARWSYFKIPSLLSPAFDTELKKSFRVGDDMVRGLAYITTGFSRDFDGYSKLVTKLLNQKEYPIGEGVKSSDGNYSVYAGNLLLDSYEYGGGGGSGWRQSFQYDSEERLILAETGSDDVNLYKLTYQNGRVVKVVYSGRCEMDNWTSEGTVTFSYDASGKLTGMTGNFVHEATMEEGSRSVRQQFRLTEYSGPAE